MFGDGSRGSVLQSTLKKTGFFDEQNSTRPILRKDPVDAAPRVKTFFLQRTACAEENCAKSDV